jgi:hypothetical protein
MALTAAPAPRWSDEPAPPAPAMGLAIRAGAALKDPRMRLRATATESG